MTVEKIRLCGVSVTLDREVLSDDSVVYDVSMHKQGEFVVTFPCVNEQHAEELFRQMARCK